MGVSVKTCRFFQCIAGNVQEISYLCSRYNIIHIHSTKQINQNKIMATLVLQIPDESLYDSVDDMFKSVLGEEAFSKIRSQHV